MFALDMNGTCFVERYPLYVCWNVYALGFFLSPLLRSFSAQLVKIALFVARLENGGIVLAACVVRVFSLYGFPREVFVI